MKRLAVSLRTSRLREADKRQDGNHDNNEADKIDDAVHSSFLGLNLVAIYPSAPVLVPMRDWALIFCMLDRENSF